MLRGRESFFGAAGESLFVVEQHLAAPKKDSRPLHSGGREADTLETKNAVSNYESLTAFSGSPKFAVAGQRLPPRRANSIAVLVPNLSTFLK